MKVYSGINGITEDNALDNIIDGCLCLEGGSFRGVYTSGVLDCMMMHGINLKTTVGVSAGALNGVNYVSGNIGRSAIINLKHRHDSNWVGVKAYRKNKSVIGFKYVFGDFEMECPLNKDRFFNGNRTLIAVATNVKTGQAEYFKNVDESIYDAVSASASMPIVCKAVEINGNKYLDGGCDRKIPIRYCLELGYDKIVVVNTRHKKYRKNLEKSGKKDSLKMILADGVYGKKKEFIEAIKSTDIRYNEDCDLLDELEKEKKIFRINPSEPINIHTLEGDMEKLGSIYWMGYHDMEKRIGELKEYLGCTNDPYVLESEAKFKLSEYKKMISGIPYNPSNKELALMFKEAKAFQDLFNDTKSNDFLARETLAKSIFGQLGKKPTINKPLYIDYGKNIYIGDNFYSNYDLILQDAGNIKIGNNVFIGPRVSIYTSVHPINAKERNRGLESTKPVVIGNDCWIGGSVTILPGVTIGNNVVIGAGAVVTKDIPSNSVAYGNPCKVERKID